MVEEMRRDPKTIYLATDAPGPSSQRVRCPTGTGNTHHRVRVYWDGDWRGWLGYRPIVNWSMVTFRFVAMDQIVNQASKIHYMFGGQAKFPIVFRASVGGGRQLAAQHSQSPYSMFMNLAGSN